MNNTALIYVHEGYADWEIGFVLPELRKAGFEIVPLGERADPVTSMGGLKVLPERTVASITDHEDVRIIILPGGESWNNPENHQRVLELTGRLHKNGVLVAGICGAVVALARMGMLDDKRHTSNYKPLLGAMAPNYSGGDLHTDNLAECDQGVVTAAGIGPIEFATQILKGTKAFTAERAEEWFNFYKNGVFPSWMLG